MLVETHLRSIVKGISWRLLATLATVLIVYFIFGRLDLAVLAGVIESVSKIALYYLHERGWQALRWGFREKHRPCVIWMTGLSGSGKTTLGLALQKSLESEHVRVQLIDGDLYADFPLCPGACESAVIMGFRCVY
jgi:adenylylsulfate kinase